MYVCRYNKGLSGRCRGKRTSVLNQDVEISTLHIQSIVTRRRKREYNVIVL